MHNLPPNISRVEALQVLIFVSVLFSLSVYSPVLGLGFYDENVYLSDIFLVIGGVALLAISNDLKRSADSKGIYFDNSLLALSLLVFLLGTIVSIYFRLQTRELLSAEVWAGPIFYAIRAGIWFLWIYFLVNRMVQSYVIDKVLVWFVLIALIPTATIYLEAFGLMTTPWQVRKERMIVEGFTGIVSPHEGHASVILVSILLAAMSLRSKATLFFVSVPMLIGAIVITQRQSMVVSLLVGIAGWFFLVPMTVGRRLLGFLFFAFVSVLVMSWFSTVGGQDLISQYITADGLMSGNMAFRLIAPLAYLAYMIENPVSFLMGFGALATTTNITLLGGAHNAYVEILFEYGAFGLFVIVIVFFRLFFVFFRMKNLSGRAQLLGFWLVMSIYGLGGNIFSLNTHGANQFLLVAIVLYLVMHVSDSRVLVNEDIK